MRTVWLVDGNTRIILPGSAWAGAVQESLRNLGHTVQRTSEDPETCVRDEAEMARMDKLLDETKL
jgi:hypothetical protein